jgi:hypothetical protein
VCRAGEGKINTVALNVVLTEATTGFDVRIAPNMEMAEFKVKINEWCAEEGSHGPPTHARIRSTSTRRWTRATFGGLFSRRRRARSASNSISIKLEAEAFPAAADSRFLCKVGVPGASFSPMAQHGHPAAQAQRERPEARVPGGHRCVRDHLPQYVRARRRSQRLAASAVLQLKKAIENRKTLSMSTMHRSLLRNQCSLKILLWICSKIQNEVSSVIRTDWTRTLSIPF